MKKENKKFLGIASAFVFALAITGFFVFASGDEVDSLEYVSESNESAVVAVEEEVEVEIKDFKTDYKASHTKTPEPVKGVYMTSWVGGVYDWRERIAKMIEETELNTLVLDIKDDTGKIGYEVFDPYLIEMGSSEKRIPDIREFLAWLHDRDIYVIGRVAVFQDPYLVSVRPDLAVKRKSDGSVWEDRKGLTWLDAGAEEVWDYVIRIARDAHASGFDEIQFDYVRFPTDGNVTDSSYPFFDKKTKEIEVTEYREEVAEDGTLHMVPYTVSKTVPWEKHDQMEEFYKYIGDNLKGEFPISADLFGYTTTNEDDLGIGQRILDAAPHFDYISPMVYPSHYNDNAFGFGNPNYAPYKIIKHSMQTAVNRFVAAGEDKLKLRPWLQDFDVGKVYTAEDVRAQIDATYDAGLTSWLLWDPSVQYTRAALKTDAQIESEKARGTVLESEENTQE